MCFSKFTFDNAFRQKLNISSHLTRAFQLEEIFTISIELIEGDGGPIYPIGATLFASPKSVIPFGEVIEYPWFIFEIVQDLPSLTDRWFRT